MKKILVIALLFIAFKASAQNPVTISAQFAEKYVGQVMSVFGNIYKITYDKRNRTMLIEFGSKSLQKGLTLTLTSDEKLQANNINFEELKGRFITVKGKIIKNSKGEISIDATTPKPVSVFSSHSLSINFSNCL